MTARIIQLACRIRAERLGLAEYTLVQLERESGLNHSVILRATRENQNGGRGPTFETIKKLADTLKVELDRELEDRFYNAFHFASPGQLAAVEPYVEQQEARETERPPTS